MELHQEDRELVRKRPATWGGYALSGWWRRVGAWLIDGFFVGAIGVVLLGKLATRIRVVRTDHKPMSFSRAAWREVVVKTMILTGVPYAGVLLELLDGLWPLWDPENRAIHDMLAGTRVVRAGVRA